MTRGVLLLSWLLCAAGLLAELRQPIYSSAAGSAAEYTAADPSAVSVRKLEGGAWEFQVLKSSAESHMIHGPAVQLPARDEFHSSRLLELRLSLEIQGAPEHFFQLRLATPDGKFVQVTEPNRSRDNLFDPNGTNRWRGRSDLKASGRIAGSFTGGKLRIYLSGATGKGKLIIHSLEIHERYQPAHIFSADQTDHIFTADNGTVEVRFRQSQDMIGGRVLVTDEANKEVEAFSVPAKTALFEVPLRQRGFYHISATASYANQPSLTTATTAAVVGPQLPQKVRDQSRYGIYRCWANWSFLDKLGVGLDYSAWNLNGIKHTPEGMTHPWKGVQYAPNVRSHAAMFIQLPQWLIKAEHRGKAGFFPPEDWQRYREAVQLWAKSIHWFPAYVEPFNEPDAQWRGTPEELARLHRETAAAIKSVRPNAKVGGPVFCNININQLRGFVNNGGLEGLDMLVMHAYVNASAPEGEFIQKIDQLKEYMATTPYAHLPIAFTEFGWTGPPGDWQKPVDELTRARYCARSMILATTRDIQQLVYFVGLFNPSPDAYNYSLIKPSGKPLPVFASYAALIRALSEVQGGGVHLQFSPDHHGAFFLHPDGNSIGCFWNAAGESALQWPVAPEQLRKMTGATLPAQPQLALSPSPIYGTWNGDALGKIRLMPFVELSPGNSFTLEGTLYHSGIFRQHGKRFTIPADAKLGDYAIVEYRDGQYLAHRYRVKAPFTIHPGKLQWDGRLSTTPQIPVVIRAVRPDLGKVQVTLALDNDTTQTRTIQLKQSGETTLHFPLENPVNGQRYYGRVVATTTANTTPWQETAQVDVTPIVMPRFNAVPTAKEWSQIPPIAINGFMRPGELKPNEISPVQAAFQGCWSPQGFHLQLKVQDQVLSRNGNWDMMWKEDSLQIAFDLDKERPWVVNNSRGRFNGHRIVEYGIAKAKNGERPEAWCFLGHAPGLRSGVSDYTLALTCKVNRDESAKVTTYQLFIPWEQLGDDGENPPECFGLAMLINDAGPEPRRRMLQYFSGINKKNPAEYGKVWIIPAQEFIKK